MNIHVATDHAGLSEKDAVVTWLRAEGFNVIDHGAHSLDPLDDFPDFISLAAQAVSNAPAQDLAVIFGGSGQGEAMLANRFPGVRAVVFYGGDESIPRLSREHNDSNILSIGARFVDIDTIKRVTWDWLHTSALPDQKYHRRNQKIESITNHIHS